MAQLSDIEIASRHTMRPITEIAERIGLRGGELEPYGEFRGKVRLSVLDNRAEEPDGRLVIVTAMTPTKAGEGKSTVTVGLGDALSRLGKRSLVAIREPSLGPCFGVKGGACGGGYAQVVPMEDINLHFNGDFHAITSANNLLSAVLDNHLHQDNRLLIDPRTITWKRVVDMNDRALRQIVIGLGGKLNGVPRQDGFDITVASEVMAVVCLSVGISQLKEQLGQIIIGETYGRDFVRAEDLGVCGAMGALLKEVVKPNLVQTLEGTPAFVHGGPFANIAHGCSSLAATRLGLKLADFVVTEAGFGSDLGLEKFVHIKCRKGNLRPSVAVIVATVRALKSHGGASADALSQEDVAAVEKGFPNLQKHIENTRQFGLEPVVALNRFHTDTRAELDKVQELCEAEGAACAETRVHAEGGKGGEQLARKVIEAAEAEPSAPTYLYDLDAPLKDKVDCVAEKVYGAGEVTYYRTAAAKLSKFEEQGFGNLPVCMAKTQSSLTDNPKILGRPRDFPITIQDARLAAGAGFVIALAGNIMTMPGLGKDPAALHIDVNEQGQISGLF